MTRRSYVQIDGILVPKDEVPQRELRADAGALWGDRSYDGQRATDGTPIDTRTKHREYMKRKGVTTIDDYTQHNEREAKRRADFYQGAPDPSRREDVSRAFEQRRTR